MQNQTTTAAIVAALRRREITSAQIVVQRATVARWTNNIGGRVVATVREFRPGEVVKLGNWRPEGMMGATEEDGREMFLFWSYLEKMVDWR